MNKYELDSIHELENNINAQFARINNSDTLFREKVAFIQDYVIVETNNLLLP
jgi:hypothetical protein